MCFPPLHHIRQEFVFQPTFLATRPKRPQVTLLQRADFFQRFGQPSRSIHTTTVRGQLSIYLAFGIHSRVNGVPKVSAEILVTVGVAILPAPACKNTVHREHREELACSDCAALLGMQH